MPADDQQQDQQDQRDVDSQDQRDDTTHDTEPDAEAALGDAGKKAIEREREARRAADKRATDLEKRIATFEKEQREAEEAKQKESGEWEKVATAREQELEALRSELAQRDVNDTKRSIARKHNLDDDAFEFITGDDEEAIEASVKKLAKLAARAADTDTDAGKQDSSRKKPKQSDSVLANYKFGTRR